MPISLFVLFAMFRQISAVLAAMKHSIVVVNIKNCIGGNIKTNAVHLRLCPMTQPLVVTLLPPVT